MSDTKDKEAMRIRFEKWIKPFIKSAAYESLPESLRKLMVDTSYATWKACEAQYEQVALVQHIAASDGKSLPVVWIKLPSLLKEDTPIFARKEST